MNKKMKIVILEKNAISNNDISFKEFEKIGDFTAYGVTPQNKISDYIADAEVVLCNKCQITREIMLRCPKLKYIGECATGYNNIDIVAAKELGICVTNAGQYSTRAVAQHVFAFILNHFSKVSEYDTSVKKGDWINSESFIYYLSPTNEISGLTLGIIGFGSIGKTVAKIADAFGMKVLVNTRTVPESGLYPYEFVSRKELFKNSDVVTLHCPLTKETENMIDINSLKLMKPSSYLVNTSRGGVINENDLAYALNNNIIAGAGVDVISREPMVKENPLISAKNCTFTPHIAWAPLQTRERLVDIVLENLKSYINGNPQNVVTK